MLVLERRVGEIIVIGNEIQIQIISIRGKVARIGITAPKEIGVYRDEVYRRIREQGLKRGKPGETD